MSPKTLLQRWAPGVSGIAALQPSEIPREIGAGVSVAAVAIPIGLAYAELVGLPPNYGLYASVLPTLVYALFGPSGGYLIVGPDTVTCLILGATLTRMGIADTEMRATTAAGVTLLVGIACLGASLLKLGRIANLISRPVLVGYLTGAAVLLLVRQLPSLSGVDLHATGILRSVVELVRRGAEIQPTTIILGAALFVGLRLGKALVPLVPWPAVAIVLAILLSWALNFGQNGMTMVGALPSGLPGFRLPSLGGNLRTLSLGALGLLVVSFSSGILTARSFGVRLGRSNNPDKELVGFGLADIAAGLFQGFAVTGADSRTAVAIAVGGRSALVGVTAAAVVALVLSFLGGVLALLPEVALGAILASAAIDLFDAQAFRRLARIDRAEFFIALAATAGVIWIGVLSGVFIAIGLTLLHVLKMIARPRDALLGRAPGSHDLETLDRHDAARPLDRIVVYLFEASILFVNAEFFRQRAQVALRAGREPGWFVLDASAMMNADSAAVDAIQWLKGELDSRGVVLLIGGGHGLFNEVLERSGLVDEIGRDRLFPTPAKAVAAAEALRDGELPAARLST